MRLLHVVVSMDPQTGGVAQAVRGMIAGLTDLDVHNEVVSLDAPCQPFSPDKLLHVHGVGPAKGPWCYSLDLIPWLVKNFSRFDGVIIHGLWLYASYAVKKAMKIYKRQFTETVYPETRFPKLFVVPHGMLDPYFQRAPGRKLKALRNWVYWKLIEADVVNEADKVLFTSEDECNLARETFRPYRPKKETVISLGVNEPPHYSDGLKDAFKQVCPDIGDKPYLLFLGRIHEKKGLDLLIDAYGGVMQEKINATAEVADTCCPKLVIAGPGQGSSYGKMIRQKVSASLFLSGNIYFAPMLEGKAKWGAFYGCEAFVLASHQENFGIAVVEAMACEKPVLISNKVNIWREIHGAGSGIINSATLGGTEQLLNSWLILTKRQRAEMGRNARKLYLDSFATQASVKFLVHALQ